MDAKFQLVDAAYCFLSRHRATLSVRNVVQIAQSLSRDSVTAADLRAMAAIAPQLLTLHTTQQHRDDVFRARELAPDEMELLTFPTVPQTSQKASQKRRKLFLAALASAQTATPPATDDPAPSQVGTTAEPKRMPPTGKPPQRSDSPTPWLGLLESLDIFREQIVHVERRAAREAQCVALDTLKLPSSVVSALEKVGIQQLYSHQHASIAATLRGDNVVLSTSTASGKSLAFNVPTLVALDTEPKSTFLYLFPTKALAQDQLKSLRQLLQAAGLAQHLCATFDGDTPMTSRSAIIKDAQIFLTNPDIMHLTILPKHTQWKRVLANLQLLVVDEAHMYRGVFGSHVASVFRRLFRLCALYGSSPRVICCSATIRNPSEHFQMLLPKLPPRGVVSGSSPKERPANFDFCFERPLCVITEDGAPSVEKVFFMWNPKAQKYAEEARADADAGEDRSNEAASTRKRKRGQIATEKEAEDDESTKSNSTSSIYQSAKIFSALVAESVHTLLFCKGRKLSELVLMAVHSVLSDSPRTKHLVKRVHTYRGGYTAEDRRRIEQRLFSGELLGVIATNALELGIDIGELDATMHLGLPGSISSLWQQAGRAGRRKQTLHKASLAVIVCFDAPLDQHFARHSSDLFQLKPEAVGLNPHNSKVVGPHLLCAAHEYPLFDSRSGLAYVDEFIFDTESPASPVLTLAKELAERQHLVHCTPTDGGGFRLHSCVPKSTRALSLRSISETNYKVVTDDDEHFILDEIPGEMIFFQVYPTAVYLHQAQEYIITRLDVDQKTAFARRCANPLTYFTACRDYTEVDVTKVQQRARVSRGADADSIFVCEGDVSVSTSVFGSTLLEKKTMRVLHANEFSLPPMQSFGHALWLELPHVLKRQVEGAAFVWAGALHGVGHLLMAVVPLFVRCDGGDINTEHYNPFERRVRPNRITIYERREGGSGVVEEVLRYLPHIVRRAWLIARECACVSGCPSCIHSAQCTEYNKVLDKRGSLMVLEYIAASYGVTTLEDSEDDGERQRAEGGQ